MYFKVFGNVTKKHFIVEKQIKLQKNVSIFTHDIVQTETFKALTFIQQKIHKNSNSRKAIENNVNICLNIGFNHWESKTTSSQYHRNIVKELVDLKSN